MSADDAEADIPYNMFRKIMEKLTKAARIIFVLVSIVYVLYSFSRTLQKFNEGNTFAKQETKYFEKYRYPSVTFCYKFKHGSKVVKNNYHPSLYKKWQATGMSVRIGDGVIK